MYASHRVESSVAHSLHVANDVRRSRQFGHKCRRLITVSSGIALFSGIIVESILIQVSRGGRQQRPRAVFPFCACSRVFRFIEKQVTLTAPGREVSPAIVAGSMVYVRDAELRQFQRRRRAGTEARDATLNRRAMISCAKAGADPSARDGIEPGRRCREDDSAVRLAASLAAVRSELESTLADLEPGRAAVQMAVLASDRHLKPCRNREQCRIPAESRDTKSAQACRIPCIHG